MNYSETEVILDEIDWDFPNIGNEGLHAFHWYPATFVSAIPGSLIPLLTKENDLVLDPFCGTSATGLEAIRLGRRYIGIDTNPIATLISRSKLLFPEIHHLRQILDFEHPDSLFQFRKADESLKHPNESKLRKWYHPRTYAELRFILSQISELRNPAVRIPAQAIFSSILKNVSSQNRHWGWVCDNVTPKPHEVSYKNALDAYQNAIHKFVSSNEDTLHDMKARGVESRRKEIRKRWTVICADTLSYMLSMPSENVDLILTSPPYYGVADYVKSQRLSFLWFDKSIIPVEGYSFDDFERLRHRETGARSFRHRKNSFDDYMNYMKEYFQESHRILRAGRYLAIVLGDSESRKDTIDLLEEYTYSAGFSKKYDVKRQIKNTRRRLMARVKYEQLKIYVK